ncbi:nitroreductase family protein [Helicobacter apodemus]|uniref:NAD(P)H-dependent oxidoreductase n=1 Tax=Helicobacter apodemus TaxID=135569 RepID=A0A2U8FBW5_9HELI|nr:nitroreductase family protein [Helicobacter apodemus]AWI33644.1 NAD(P)H-dependent oxidoreductase [Helicobacter apodemus]
MQKEIFKKILEERFSCREFQEKLLSKEELDYILEAGRLSPSSLGLEPWRFIVIEDNKTKQEIAEIANSQKHVAKCGAIIIVVARLDFGEYFVKKLQSRNMSKEELQKRIELYKPFIESMNPAQKLHYAREQTFLALGNLANGATALNLGSCIIGGFNNEALDIYLKLDTSKEKTSIMLVVGHRKTDEIPQKIRFSKEEVIDFSKNL